MGGLGSKISNEVFVSHDVSLTNQDMIILQGENKSKVEEMAIEVRELNKNSEFKECEVIYNNESKRWRQEFYFHRYKAKLPMVKITDFTEY